MVCKSALYYYKHIYLREFTLFTDNEIICKSLQCPSSEVHTIFLTTFLTIKVSTCIWHFKMQLTTEKSKKIVVHRRL